MKIQLEDRHNVNKVNDKVNDIYSIHSHYKGNHRRGAAAECLRTFVQQSATQAFSVQGSPEYRWGPATVRRENI